MRIECNNIARIDQRLLCRAISGFRFPLLPALLALSLQVMVTSHSPVAIANSAPAASSESWYAILLQGRPIGGDHESEAAATLNGHKCLLSVSASDTALVVMGSSVRQHVVSRTWSDLTGKHPLREQVVMISGGVITTITAALSSQQIQASLNSGGRVQQVTIPIPPNVTLLADDPMLAASTIKGSAKTASAYVYFDPQSLSLQPMTMTPLPSSLLPVGAKGALTRMKRLKVTMPNGVVIVTEDASGETLRVDLPAGLSMARVPERLASAYIAQARGEPEQAGAGIVPGAGGASPAEPSTPDFAVVTSVLPTGATLPPSPTHLQAEVITASGEKRIFDLREVPVPTPQQEAGFATVSAIASSDKLRPDLADAPYLGLGDQAVQRKARQITGSATSCYDIAMRIEDWLHENMTATPVVGLPRSASEILRDKQGVCRDYALLFTALARSVGVPTRLCGGLVGYKGRFYYHAWAECYVGGQVNGGNGWMPFDPTLYEKPVDASHIPLVKGEPADLYSLESSIGSIQVRLL